MQNIFSLPIIIRVIDLCHEIWRLKIFLVAPMGLELVSSFPGWRATHYTTAPWLVKSISNLLVPIIHGRWCCNKLLLLQCFHTVRAPLILLYRYYSPDQLISRTRGPIRLFLLSGNPKALN